MVDQKIIDLAVQRLVKAGGIQKVILFGSYARGVATEDSDLDFLVIEPQVRDKGLEMIRLRNAIKSIGVGVDILVYSLQELKERKDVPGSTLRWALAEGKVMYEAR